MLEVRPPDADQQDLSLERQLRQSHPCSRQQLHVCNHCLLSHRLTSIIFERPARSGRASGSRKLGGFVVMVMGMQNASLKLVFSQVCTYVSMVQVAGDLDGDGDTCPDPTVEHGKIPRSQGWRVSNALGSVAP